jgi:hypothetical protein
LQASSVLLAACYFFAIGATLTNIEREKTPLLQTAAPLPTKWQYPKWISRFPYVGRVPGNILSEFLSSTPRSNSTYNIP